MRTAVAAGILVAFASCSRDDAPSRPNFLFISIDTLRADHLGVYGYEQPTSPNLDAFARTAVVFDEAFSHSSWTLTSFATMLTSTYSHTHGCAEFHHRLHESFPTFPELLGAAGYRTAAVISHVFLGPRHGLMQGIQELDQELLVEIDQSHEQISSPTVTEKGIAFLEAAARQPDSAPPWMLWLHYFDPHEIYRRHSETASAFPGDSEISLYDGEIAFTDLWLGKLFAALERLELDEDTVVIVVADHGEEFGEHGEMRHGRTLYREVLRVPLLIRVPGVEPRRIATTVRTLDLLPTITELAGIATPDFAQGISLVPAMRGAESHDLPVYGDVRLRSDYIAESIQVNGWKLILDRSGASLRTKSTVSVAFPDGREKPSLGLTQLLFNVRADPHERNDVAAREPEIVARLVEFLGEERKRARELARSGHFASGPSVELDAAARKQLEQLGY